MHADGTGEREAHVVLRVQSEGAARQFGVLSFSYAAASETPSILLVRVHKPDGTTVDTPVSDAIEMPAAVTREAPLYSDLKEKHLPVRSLSPGDTLEYQVRTTINKAEAPGQFWGAQHFTAPGSIIVLAEVLTLEVPKDKYIQVWSPNHKPTISDHDNLRTYRWEVAQLVPAPKSAGQGDDAASAAPKDPDETADGRKLPSVAWTTFHSWAEVGDWYRSLALARAQPNDAVRARAAEITKDARTPEDQVRAIYTFVSSRTRYVGIDFGVGRYQPHAAADVLANQYGDCKDKDTLLEALLSAKGFHTAPALVGAGLTPVEDVPSPAVFNHVITTVDMPGGSIWLDSTPEVAPYRYLSAAIRDQLALVIPPAAPAALQRTPAVPPYPLSARFEAVGSIDAEGKLTSHITASYRTDDEVFVRALARSVAPAEQDKVSQYVSSATGFGGTTSNTSITNLDDLSAPIVLRYDYTRHPYGDWDNLRITPAFPALEFSALASDTTAPPQDIQLGAPRTLVASCTIHLPEGYRADLPDPYHVKTDFATFDKTYRFDGKTIVVERNITVLKEKLPKADWKQYQKFTKDISLDTESWIQLIKPATVTIVQGDKKPAEPPAPEGQSSAELLYAATQRIRVGDWPGATEILDKLKAKSPEQEGLWSSYGFVALAQKKYAEAETDYKKELSLHAENAYAANGLAEALNLNGNHAAALRTLEDYLARHSGDLPVTLHLAALQNAAKDYTAAAKTLEAASKQHPEDREVRLQLSYALVKLDRNDEAAAVAKSVVEGNDDPRQLNQAAYALALAGLDLPVAEEISRKSISLLEAKSAAISTAEVNSKAFADANLLVASWDTLGWILFREGKLEEAQPLIAAGWRNALLPESGDHLGQVLEAMGKKQDALSAYRLAAASSDGKNAEPEVLEHITASITRLGGAKASTHGGTQALQDLRTYRVDRPAGLSGWGTFRLQLNTNGVLASQQMSGDDKLAALTKGINATKFAELVPPGSQAHLLRSAVVSCSMGTTCELVLVPNSNLRTEQP